MAARLRTHHQDEIRTKIQASQLINVLTNHALGKTDMEPSRIKAIEILLRKSLPDLQAITLDGNLTVSAVDELARLNAKANSGA